MDSKQLIIFPSSRQISLLCSTAIQEDTPIYLVLHSKDEMQNAHNSRIIFVGFDDLDGIGELQSSKVRVLCCHEEAIFWARMYRGEGWEFSFDTKYFNLLEKHTFKSFAQAHGLPSGISMLTTEGITKFPVIAKPSIGFGSICVHSINSMPEAENYAQNFDDMIKSSAIYHYQTKYFGSTINIPIFEDMIDGEFFRTPFIVEGGKCTRIFPVRGITKRKKSSTDFNWIEFEYSPSEAAHAAEKTIWIHDVLAENLRLDDGVYISEFILSGNDEPVLLEFSPRQSSSRISRMIYFAEGVDLEQEALMYFFRTSRKNYQHQCMNCAHDIRLRLHSEGVHFPELEGYEIIHDISEVSVHGDKIQCKYFRRLA